MKNFILKNWQLTLLVILIVPFLIFQLMIINRPFFWDEAWSYASAIEAMYQNGPSILPGAIDTYLYRGHPTFFYFFTTVWMKIFGPSLVSIHSFFIIISTFLIFTVFIVGSYLAGKTVGLLASACLLATPLFIAQAGFLLPEVMLALFSLLTVYFYFKQKIVLEIVFGTLLLYTKETGIVLIGTLLLFDFIKRLIKSKSVKAFFNDIPTFSFHLIPVVMVSLFFIIQKIKLGWFFYPEHMGMMTFDYYTVKDKIIRIIKYLVKEEGRFLLTFVLAATSLFYILKKEKNTICFQYVLFSILFIALYVVFSALNFYTVRYTMSIFPFLFVTFGVVLYYTLGKYKAFMFIPAIAFIVLSLKYSIKPDGVGDSSIGFLRMVKVHQKMVGFCENANLYSKGIGTHFLMLYNLKSTFMGYLSFDRIFKKANELGESYLEFVVISNIELSEHAKNIQQSDQYQLLERYEEGPAWCEIYQKKGSTTVLPL